MYVLSNLNTQISKTSGADNPLTNEGEVPLMNCDVWEHAYYLDYKNLRNTYVDVFMDNLVNWDMASARLAESDPPLY